MQAIYTAWILAMATAAPILMSWRDQPAIRRERRPTAERWQPGQRSPTRCFRLSAR